MLSLSSLVGPFARLTPGQRVKIATMMRSSSDSASFGDTSPDRAMQRNWTTRLSLRPVAAQAVFFCGLVSYWSLSALYAAGYGFELKRGKPHCIWTSLGQGTHLISQSTSGGFLVEGFVVGQILLHKLVCSSDRNAMGWLNNFPPQHQTSCQAPHCCLEKVVAAIRAGSGRIEPGCGQSKAADLQLAGWTMAKPEARSHYSG